MPLLGSVTPSLSMIAGVLDLAEDLTDWLNDVSANWWFLLVIFAIAFFDSVIPVVPSETTVIIGGVAASQGNQTLALVIIAGAVGAFLGDNTAYAIGHRFHGWIERRAEQRPKTRERLDWARNQIKQRGGPLLITARFIPGGRTALTVSSGLTHQPRAWFAGWVAIAATIWASYAAGLAYVVGERFKDNHNLAFWTAFATALSITLLLEVVRHFRHRRRKGREAAAEPVDTEVTA